MSVSGYGFWSGRDVKLTFRPAEANQGITFVRTDLSNQPRIPAVIQNRVDGPRRTTLVAHGCPVEMVEHVLAALAGMQIDNCDVHVDQAEMPGLDGSSEAFVKALQQTKQVQLSEDRQTKRVTGKIRVEEGDTWIQAEPSDSDSFELTYNLDYHCPAIGRQSYSATVTPKTFVTDISPARTFVLQSEAEKLQQQGLGQRVTYQDVMVFTDDGLLENQLRFENECARHKLLDMIGDLSLSGFDLIGKFTASKSGHRLNSRMVFQLLQQTYKQNKVRISA